MIKRTTIKAQNGGEFVIQNIDGVYNIIGNIEAAKIEFRKIHRMPPNEYGNFYGREKAGFMACKELEEKYNHSEK